MQNTSNLSPTFYKGKPFWEKQDSFRKTAATNKEIPTTVREILLQANPTRTQIPEALAQENPIKTRVPGTRVLETPAPGTPVPEKGEFILGCLPVHLRRKLWHRIFRWSAIKARRRGLTVITVINRRGGRKEGILPTNKEIMRITEDHGINMTRRSGVIMLLPLQELLRRHLQAQNKNWRET